MPSPRVVIVAAMSATTRAIGRKNSLPWRLPGDMKLFRENTLGKTILMGRKTAHSIGNTLPKRTNLVLTSGEAPFPGQIKVASMEEALTETMARVENELVVIGGGQVYRLALPYASKICLTTVNLDVPDGDTFFPELELGVWRTTRHEFHLEDGKFPSFVYNEYQRPGPTIF